MCFLRTGINMAHYMAQCNRRYPCNQCTRRRRPEECTYYPSQTTSVQAANPAEQITNSDGREEEHRRNQFQMQSKHMVGHEAFNTLSSSLSISRVQGISETPATASLAGVFGYFEDSESNTLALIRKLSLQENDGREARLGASRANKVVLPPDTITEVQNTLERMPDRPVVDFLIQYYVAQVHWSVSHRTACCKY